MRFVLAVLLLSSAAFAAPELPVRPLSPDQVAEVRAAAMRLRQAILDADTATVLDMISRRGLSYVDSAYSYREIKAFLADKKSLLYVSLFDTAGFAKRCPSRPGDDDEYLLISDQEFLRTANPQMEITGSQAKRWADVKMTSPVPRHYPREWTFIQEAGKWRVGGETFAIGDCF